MGRWYGEVAPWTRSVFLLPKFPVWPHHSVATWSWVSHDPKPSFISTPVKYRAVWEITQLYKAFACTYYVSYQYMLRTLWRVPAFPNICCSNSYLAFVLPVSVWLGLPLWKRNRSWITLPCYSVTCNWSFTFSFQAWAVALPPFLLVSTSSCPSRSIASLFILMKNPSFSYVQDTRLQKVCIFR